MPEESDDDVRELSDAQLHDLRRVAMPTTQAEAAYLVDLLEEAGIPAVIQGERLTGLVGGFPTTDIRVPNALREKALAVIEQARNAMHDRGVDAAFVRENIQDAEEDERADPMIFEMQNLSVLEPGERESRLEKFILDWSVDGTSSVQMAQYLAVAGLDRERAETLVNKVQAENNEKLSENKDGQKTMGIAALVIGIGLTFFSFLIAFNQSNQRGVSIYIVFSGLILSGFGYMVASRSKIPNLTRRSKQEES